MDKQTEKQTITPEKTITEYSVLAYRDEDVLAELVNKRLKKNWHLYGNLIVTSYCLHDEYGNDDKGLMYTQALVKYN